MSNGSPTLYLFPSPLSEAPVSDVLPALNIELIARIKHFVVENVRPARRFLKACNRDINIDLLTFYELNNHTDPAEIEAMLKPMAEGADMGLISDAGCPAVADPGAILVSLAHRKGFRVMPLVGPSSILLALMASGFNGQHFAFNGYLPIDSKQRADTLRRLHYDAVRNRCTHIFIETPYRNNRMIADIIAALPPSAMLCVAADVTGPGQSVVSLPVARWKLRSFNYDKIPAIFLIYDQNA